MSRLPPDNWNIAFTAMQVQDKFVLPLLGGLFKWRSDSAMAALAREYIESLEITDHITKLFTFKYGQQRSREEQLKARESGRPLSVLLLGIDNFKDFNDRCGQESGDKALGEIAGRMKLILSENDLSFRYGGRLLCCLLPGRTVSEVKPQAENLRRLIAEHRFLGPDGKNDQVITTSIGLFEYRGQKDILTLSELFKAAMACLHRAEAAGGNMVHAE